MNAVTEEDISFPIVVAISLWIRNPLFTAKNAISNSSIIFYVTTGIKYDELAVEISKAIENEQCTTWNFVDWATYSILPFDIRSRSFQHGGNRPVERIIEDDQDIREALAIMEYDESGDHLAVNVTMYEGDEPPEDNSPSMQDKISAYQNHECEVCGYEHGIGECRAANGGIRIRALEDENDTMDDEDEDEKHNFEPSDDDEDKVATPNWEPDDEDLDSNLEDEIGTDLQVNPVEAKDQYEGWRPADTTAGR